MQAEKQRSTSGRTFPQDISSQQRCLLLTIRAGCKVPPPVSAFGEVPVMVHLLGETELPCEGYGQRRMVLRAASWRRKILLPDGIASQIPYLQMAPCQCFGALIRSECETSHNSGETAKWSRAWGSCSGSFLTCAGIPSRLLLLAEGPLSPSHALGPQNRNSLRCSRISFRVPVSGRRIWLVTFFPILTPIFTESQNF